jgi:hypothetical protein
MPYWSISCLYCLGEIIDALLECIPSDQRERPAFQRLFMQQSGAVLACPYCNGYIGFSDAGVPIVPEPGWPVFRYGRAELELKKLADGAPAETSLSDWALRHRFVSPGLRRPFVDYVYAEQAPPHEVVR